MTEPTAAPHVSIRSVSVRYRTGLEAIQGVSLDVKRNEVVAIVGPSGSGKTTLLNAVASVLDPGEAGMLGHIAIDGIPVTQQRRPPLSLGYLFEHDGLLPWRTLSENIGLGLEIRGVDRDSRARQVTELVEEMGLSGSERAYPDQLSAGMRQRAALARTLAVNPTLVLADEPFGRLDVQIRARLHAELLTRRARNPFTLLLVTHDVDEAITLSHRVVVFTARPARVRQVIDVSLPWPRNPIRLRSNPEFLRLSAVLWQALMEGD